MEGTANIVLVRNQPGTFSGFQIRGNTDENSPQRPGEHGEFPEKRTADKVEIHFKVLGRPNEVPNIPDHVPVPTDPPLDVVIVGGGLSGLSAAWKLSDKNTLLLEWMDTAGGLAMQGQRDGVTYAQGAAYFTKPEGELLDFYREIGLGDPEKVEIPEPIDSYLADGRLVEEVWGTGLQELPPEFGRFKHFLELLSKAEMIGGTPFEEESDKVKMLDKISAAQLLKPFGPRVKTFLDLYCRSALGAPTDQISAMAFLNFYRDEIGPRYAFKGGTGGVSEQLDRKIREKNPNLIQSGSLVYDVHNREDGLVEVRYNKDGKNHSVLAKQVIMALPLSAASRVIKDLPESRKNLFNSIEHCNYIVHNVFTPEQVFDKSYDTWVKDVSFTDVIVTRWQETKAFTIPGSREGEGILTVYQPLPKKYWNGKMDEKDVRKFGQEALSDLERLFPKMKEQKWIDVESFRWPQSIHITKPGQITEQGERLREPHGKILFAGNNLGVPSFEEALIRGLQAAETVGES
ncbi:MAG: FAD-dependent oxidoreductase [Armatimonadetes bacterium]|nr:FAD-dependent oxidoreductase [Armatimonadota bacterium]